MHYVHKELLASTLVGFPGVLGGRVYYYNTTNIDGHTKGCWLYCWAEATTTSSDGSSGQHACCHFCKLCHGSKPGEFLFFQSLGSHICYMMVLWCLLSICGFLMWSQFTPMWLSHMGLHHNPSKHPHGKQMCLQVLFMTHTGVQSVVTSLTALSWGVSCYSYKCPQAIP